MNQALQGNGAKAPDGQPRQFRQMPIIDGDVVKSLNTQVTELATRGPGPGGARLKDIALLLERGASPDSRDGNGNTLLMLAAFWEWPALTKHLLARNALLNERSHIGLTELIMAAGYRNSENVRMLLDAAKARFGGDAERHSLYLNARSNDGRSALDSARQAGHEEIARMLREAGAHG